MKYVPTMDSCERDQSIEPSATMNYLEYGSSTLSSNAYLSDSTSISSTEPNETPISKKRRKIFVPDNETRKKRKPKKMLTLF